MTDKRCPVIIIITFRMNSVAYSFLFICTVILSCSDGVDVTKAQDTVICVKQLDCPDVGSVCSSQLFFSACKHENYFTPDWPNIARDMKLAYVKLQTALNDKKFSYIEAFVDRLPIHHTHPWSTAVLEYRYADFVARYKDVLGRVEIDYIGFGKHMMESLMAGLEQQPVIPSTDKPVK